MNCHLAGTSPFAAFLLLAALTTGLRFALAPKNNVSVAGQQAEPQQEGEDGALRSACSDDQPIVGKQSLGEWLEQWRGASVAERISLMNSATVAGLTPDTGPPNPAAYERLRELTGSQDPVEREAACALLLNDREGASQTLPHLRTALQDPESWVRLWAAESLSHLAWFLGERDEVFTDGIDELIALGGNPDDFLRRIAVERLCMFVSMQPRLVDVLPRFLDDSVPEIRRATVSGLSFFLDTSDVPVQPLMRALRDTVESVRIDAARGLLSAKRGGGPVLAVLLQSASSQDLDNRRSTVWSLGDFGPAYASDVCPVLLDALDDPDRHVRTNACGAIGNICSSGEIGMLDAIPRLLELVKDPDPEQRGAAAWALGNVGADAETVVPALAPLVMDPSKDARGYASGALARYGAEVVRVLATLIEALDHHEETARFLAAKLVANCGAQAAEAVPVLVRRIQDPSTRVRVWSIYALRHIGAAAAPAILPLLETLKNDPAPEVRLEAVRLFAALGSAAAGAADALVAALKDRSRDVRLWSVWALGEIGVRSDAVVDVLGVATTNPDVDVSTEAVKALHKLGLADQVHAAPPIPLHVTVPYQNLAVLVSGTEGVAVIAFDRIDDGRGSCSGTFHYRYLDPKTGEVTESDQSFPGESSTIGEGPLRFDWRFTASHGVASWHPEHLHLGVVDRDTFAAIDLRRFLR